MVSICNIKIPIRLYGDSHRPRQLGAGGRAAIAPRPETLTGRPIAGDRGEIIPFVEIFRIR
jgi:hypothetical protein